MKHYQPYKWLVPILLLLSCFSANAQLKKPEYFFDTDPGVGNGFPLSHLTAVQGANFDSASFSGAVYVPAYLSPGIHTIYVRIAHNDDQWSNYEARKIYVSKPNSIDLVAAEYFFDTDPGVGNAHPISLNAFHDTAHFSGNIPTAGLKPGYHNLYIRVRNVQGAWSNYETRKVKVLAVGNLFSNGEYFFDTDPGVGRGTAFHLNGNGDTASFIGQFNTAGLKPGLHLLHIRVIDGQGQWSNYETRKIVIQQSNSLSAEYFVDEDPGVGNGSPVQLDANGQFAGNIALKGCLTIGNHYLYIRAKDANGVWGLYDSVSFYMSTIHGHIDIVSVPAIMNSCSGNHFTVHFTSTGLFNEGNSFSVQLSDVSGSFAHPVTIGSLAAAPNGCAVPDSIDISIPEGTTPASGYQIRLLSTDQADTSAVNTTPLTIQPWIVYYRDFDGDGFGDVHDSTLACTPPEGYVTNHADCDDHDAAAHQQYLYYVDADLDGYGTGGPVLLCAVTAPVGYSVNNTDCNDADASIHEPVMYYVDADHDGYGSSVTAWLCTNTPPAGYATNNTDCNDADASIHAPVMYYVDADHDGYGSTTAVWLCSLTAPTGYSTNQTDCDDADSTVHETHVFYIDADHDGFGSSTAVALCAVTAPYGYASNHTDCDDNNPAIHQQQVYYLDADHDGYGAKAHAIMTCSLTPPAGYVADSTDCNDADSLEHPGQVWYLDLDGDHYGAGVSVVQCNRPLYGFTAAELISIDADCNDHDAHINPTAQQLTFSGNTNFTHSVCNPLNGSSYTNFTFEVKYTDVNNGLPPATFPRVVLDYESNGVYNDANDRTIVMSPSDVNDLNTSDGKIYRATISQLPIGTNWAAHIEVVNGGCLTSTAAFNYPDVLVQPDIQLFANDITFSNNHPDTAAALTVSATIHNVSDYPAQNFYAHLVNQYDTSIHYADVLVSSIAPNSSTNVSWNIITPHVPAWCPMQVSIDYTNVIAETNELDNSAIRPFINGNYNFPGAILAGGAASPTVSYATPNAHVTVSGAAYYTGTAIPLQDSSVAGATVTFTIAETNQTFTTNTNSSGLYSYTFPMTTAGVYHVTGSITDYTLTGNFSCGFTLVVPPCSQDLISLIQIPQTTIVAGNTISGNIRVQNMGCATAPASLLQVYQTGGSPALGSFNVPSLAAGEQYNIPFSNIHFNTAGTYTISTMADAGLLIGESDESNNSSYMTISVLPALPDIYSYDGPYGTYSLCNNPSTNLGFVLRNGGGVATGQFTTRIVVKLNGDSIGVVNKLIPSIDPLNLYSFSIPYTYSNPGVYSFEVQSDAPLNGGVVTETDESNNSTTYSVSVYVCPPPPPPIPNLVIVGQSCQQVIGTNLEPVYPGTTNLLATVLNNGTDTAKGPIQVLFSISDGSTYLGTYIGNLLPGQQVNVVASMVTVPPATQSIHAMVDPNNTVHESNEADNETGNESLCWEFQLQHICDNPEFYDRSYLLNQSTQLFIGVQTTGNYLANAVKVRFEVSGPGITGVQNLGDATIANPRHNCTGCPNMAMLPTNFVFSQTGTFTFKMTVDPDNVYTECDESNNVMVVNVNVVNVPDMRELSQYIAPSKLNPAVGEAVNLNISYDNIGVSNINDRMKMKVYVDDNLFSTVNPVTGLVSGDNATIAIPQTWSSTVPGVHIIRAVIDADNVIAEGNENNNEATRAIVVGQSANMHFLSFTASNAHPLLGEAITINAAVENNGDLGCESDVQYFYINNNGDSIFIGSLHVNLSPHSSRFIQKSWFVADNMTTLVGKIVNSSTLEYTYDDNMATCIIGALNASITSLKSCNGNADGVLTVHPTGGQSPYNYAWSNGATTDAMVAAAGNYSVLVTDANGDTVRINGIITNQVANLYYLDHDQDGYGDAAHSILVCTGAPAGYVSNSNDCDDNNPLVTLCVATSSTTTLSICKTALPYHWNGLTIGASGTYTVHLLNVYGADSTANLNLTVSSVKPAKPLALTQTLIANNCGARVYRFTVKAVTGATGYEWTLPVSVGGVAGVSVDSGDIHSSATIRLVFASNLAAISTDSIKVAAYSGCGNSGTKGFKLNNVLVSKPLAPKSITITPIVTNVCGARRYRYTMPVTPAATATLTSATGYIWEFTGVLGANAFIDSGNIHSRVITVVYTNNAAAVVGDSVRAYYTSSCGVSAAKSMKLTNTVLNVPGAPTITISPIVTNVCGARRYRYSVPVMPAATATATAASGYNWSFTGNLGTNGTIDSGNIHSRVITVIYTSNAAAVAGDSVKAFYSSSCGNGATKSMKLSNTALNVPVAPATINVTAVSASVCGARIYRFTAPDLPVATASNTAATGYNWTFTGPLAASGTLDSGNIHSKVIRVKFTSNDAAAAGDSIRVAFTSDCGNSINKAVKLTNTLLTGCNSSLPRLSAVVGAPIQEGIQAMVYPNPNKGAFTVGLKTNHKGGTMAMIQVVGLYGNILQSFKVPLSADGSARLPIEIKNITSGVFQVRYIIEQETGYVKMELLK